MELAGHKIDIPARQPFTLRFMGDFHVGSAGCDEGNLKDAIKAIQADPFCRWIFMGDGCECITPIDGRWDLSSINPRFHQYIDNLPQAQVNYLLSLLDPIKEKCLGWHVGNHETKIRRTSRAYDPGFDYNAFFPHGVIPLGAGLGAIRLHLTFNGLVHTVKVLSQHGYGGATTDGAKWNRVKKMAASFPDFNIYAMGHVHKYGVEAEPALEIPNRGELTLVEKRRTFVLTGCFLKTYVVGHAGYGEVRNYPASELGAPSIQFRDVNISRKAGHQLVQTWPQE